MKKALGIIIKMIVGFLFCAIGVVMSVNSKLGLSPWDVLHQGLTNITPLTMGQASIIVGLVIVIISTLLGSKVGVGTIGNMILIGYFIDLVMKLDFIPVSHNLFTGIIMMIAGMFFMAMAGYLYISCELGCGPRDGLMIALVRITKKPIWLIRGSIEVSALAVGWMLGGLVGIGTIISALGIGYCVEIVFKIFKFNASSIKHKDLKETFSLLSRGRVAFSEGKSARAEG